MQYSSDDHFVYLTGTPYHLKDEVKEKLSGTWTKKGWRFPKNVYSMRELIKFFPELRGNQDFIQDGKVEAENEKQTLYRKEHFKFGDPDLREYQNQDAAFIESRGNLAGGCLVLNEPRTGKTPTVIKTINALAPKSVIIVTPSSLTYNWFREIEKWSSTLTPFVYSGTPKQREKILRQYRDSVAPHKALIISKDTLKIDKEIQDMVFSVAIIDEAHFLRNYKTAQSKAVFKLTAHVKYALTGTPAVKHGVDVYGLLHFINPKGFPSYWQFADRYWNINDNGWGKDIGEPKKYRETELMKLMEVNSVQRKRKEVMKWLPEAQHENLFVKMTGKQLKLYDQMFDTFVASFGEGDDIHEVDTMNHLSQLLRLRQLCLDPRLLGFEGVVGAKTEALLEFAENNQEPFIIMTTFSSYFKLIKPELEKLGKRVGIIDGSISQQAKMETAEAFQAGQYDILLCNIIAAGTGFTLDRADTILFLDKDFNPANNEQAQDRIVPTTEERYHPINIISLVCGGSVDERVNEILDNKEDLTKLINKPKELIGV